MGGFYQTPMSRHDYKVVCIAAQGVHAVEKLEGKSYLVMLLLGVAPDKRLNHLITELDGSAAPENKTGQVTLH